MTPVRVTALTLGEGAVLMTRTHMPTWALGRCFRTYSLSTVGSDSHSNLDHGSRLVGRIVGQPCESYGDIVLHKVHLLP